MIFAASVCTSAHYEESSSEDKDSVILGWQNITGINVTFYVINGRAYVSYFVNANAQDIEITVKMQKQTLFWFDAADEKIENSGNKKYISGSYSVPVDGSDEYRVKVTVKVQGETETKTVEFSYDEKKLMGDANSDGYIRTSDARLILRCAAWLEIFTQEQISRCDMNLDGAITASDARTVLRMSANLI